MKRAADFLETVLTRQYSTQLAPTDAMATPHLPAPAPAAAGSFVPQTAAMVAMNDYVSASTQFGAGVVEKYEASDSGEKSSFSNQWLIF